MIEHRDETGLTCARHPSATVETLGELALVGSAVLAFHHDAASKIQRLIMAVAELEELAETRAILRAPVESLHSALGELQTLFVENRHLARGQERAPIELADLIGQIARRANVIVQGDIPRATPAIHAVAVIHALAPLFDQVSTIGPQGRVLPLAIRVDTSVTLVLPAGAPTPEVLSITTWAVSRSGGELRCTADSFSIQLPLA